MALRVLLMIPILDLLSPVMGRSMNIGASLVPALFIFGDSTLDTGNNNFVNSSQTRADHLPYGRDFVPPGPAGRFSNGKLPGDFVAEFLGLPYPIDFYNPEAKNGQKLLQGVNFASAGSGVLDKTGNSSGSISLSMQLQNFILVQRSVSQLIGRVKMAQWTANSIVLISSGGNDFIDYKINLGERIKYNKQAFNSLMISKIVDYTQILYNLGARKMVIVSSGPLGCLPVALTVFLSLDGHCIHVINTQVNNFNAGLKSSISMLATQLPGAKIIFGNIYDSLLAAAKNPTPSGFKHGHKACCGNGIYGGASKCSTSVSVCANASEYVFWDLVHPTQAMYKILADGIISGSQSIASPFNLAHLVKL